RCLWYLSIARRRPCPTAGGVLTTGRQSSAPGGSGHRLGQPSKCWFCLVGTVTHYMYWPDVALYICNSQQYFDSAMCPARNNRTSVSASASCSTPTTPADPFFSTRLPPSHLPIRLLSVFMVRRLISASSA